MYYSCYAKMLFNSSLSLTSFIIFSRSSIFAKQQNAKMRLKWLRTLYSYTTDDLNKMRWKYESCMYLEILDRASYI